MADTRFPDLTVDTADPALRPTLEQVAAGFGGTLPTAVARMATSPATLQTFLHCNAVYNASSLTPIQRETVVMTLAVRNGCRICISLHTHELRTLGADHGLIDALRSGEPAAQPELRALQDFTIALCERTGDVTDRQFATFIEAGFTRVQALEVVLGIGTYTISTFANRLTGA